MNDALTAPTVVRRALRDEVEAVSASAIAFDRVVDEHGPALRRLVGAWERDAAAREDLLQEILLALWRALPSFRGECSPRTFVFRVAHNRALTHRFKPRHRAEPLDAALHVAADDPGPEADAVAAQRLERLRRALRALPVAARQVLTLSLEGLSGAEMAAVLGITESNVGAPEPGPPRVERGAEPAMSMPESDWDALASSWRAASEPPVEVAPLHRLLGAQRRRLLATAVGEAVLVAGFAVLSWLVVRDGMAAWEAVWLLTLWAFTVVAVGFAWWNRRGTWRSLGASVEEHVRLARRRAERRRRAVAFAGALLAAETVAIVAQLVWFDRVTPLVVALLAVVGAGIGVGCVVALRRSRRELERLADYEREAAVS